MKKGERCDKHQEKKQQNKTVRLNCEGIFLTFERRAIARLL